MRVPRFHCPSAAGKETGTLVRLDERESRHLVVVLRRTAGDAVRLLPGTGEEWEGTVTEANPEGALVRLERRVERELEAAGLRNPGGLKACVGLALARGGAFELALEHLAELDADEVTPLLCKRCVVQVSRSQEVERKRERWERILQSACKQSTRRDLPVLHPPMDWTDWVLQETARPPKEPSGLQTPDGVWIATPESASLTLFEEIEEWILHEWGPGGPTGSREGKSRISVAIGPEGGFSPEEMRLALDRGIRPARLGDHVLRVATAAAAAMTAIRLAIHHASS